MHYQQAPSTIDHQGQQFSASPDLVPVNELKIKYRKLDPYTSDEIKILLLENISEKAVKIFKDAGFKVQCVVICCIDNNKSLIYRLNLVRRRFLPKN